MCVLHGAVCGCWHGTLLWKQQWWSLCGADHSPTGTERDTARSGFSLAQLGFPIYPSHSSPSLHSFSSSPFSQFSFSSSHPLCVYPSPLFIPPCRSPLLSHSFFCPTKTAIHPWHLKANKTFSENAKPAQKCHRSRDFCLNFCSSYPCFVFRVH